MGICDLFKYSSVLLKLLITTVLMFVTNYCFYASIFALEALKLNLYFNSILSSIADLIGTSLTPKLLSSFKRKKVIFCFIFLVLLAAIGFLVTVIPESCLADRDDYCW